MTLIIIAVIMSIMLTVSWALCRTAADADDRMARAARQHARRAAATPVGPPTPAPCAADRGIADAPRARARARPCM